MTRGIQRPKRVQRHSRLRRQLFGAVLGAMVWPLRPAHAAEPAPPLDLKPPPKPTAMPAFDLPTTAGSRLDSKSLKGQVLVIRFWASW